MKKIDVEFHRIGYGGDAVPAVNVKVQDSFRDVTLPLELGQMADGPGEPLRPIVTEPEFTQEWIEANLTEAEINTWFEAACADGWEQLQDEADEIWLDRTVKVWSEGRSGGWAYVEGIPAIESWDAEDFSRWAKFSDHAKVVASDISRATVWLIHANVFETRAQRHTVRVRVNGIVEASATFTIWGGDTTVAFELDGHDNVAGLDFTDSEIVLGHWPDGEQWVAIETIPLTSEDPA